MDRELVLRIATAGLALVGLLAGIDAIRRYIYGDLSRKTLYWLAVEGLLVGCAGGAVNGNATRILTFGLILAVAFLPLSS